MDLTNNNLRKSEYMHLPQIILLQNTTIFLMLTNSIIIKNAKVNIQALDCQSITTIRICLIKELMYGKDNIINRPMSEIILKNLESSSRGLLWDKLINKTKNCQMKTIMRMKEPGQSMIQISETKSKGERFNKNLHQL